MKRAYRVENLLANSSKFNITVNDGEITLINYGDVRKIFDMKYSDWLFLSKYDDTKTKEENIANTKERFSDLFELWKNDNQNNFDMLYSALFTEYNPLENYDRKEDGGWIDELHKGSKTSNGFKETVIPDLETETTNRTKIKSSDFVYGFDSATASPTGYSEVEPYSGTDKFTQTGNSVTERLATDNYTETTDISGTVFDNNKHKFENYHVHGNIGVTLATKMINEEINTRARSLVSLLLDNFANEYLFYADCLEVVE